MTASLPALLLPIAATIAVYLAAEQLYRRTRIALLNPVLVSIAVIAAALLALRIPYARYDAGARYLGWLLAPSVVALGVPLFRQLAALRRHVRAIATALVCGSAAGVLAATLVAALLGAPASVVRSLAPRSVTTPIAIQVSERAGGIPALSAIVVILSGVVGAAIGIPLLRALGVRGRTATGLALGAAAHGVGTARAAEEGIPEAAAAGLAIGSMGVLTALWVPAILALLQAAGVVSP
ncbi:MAG TPA: LrgB family protein [Gemmatimonadaceae bacterium]